MNAIDNLLGHIEDIKQSIPDAKYMDMLSNLHALHREITQEQTSGGETNEDISLNLDRLHLADEYIYNLIRNIVGRNTSMNAGHLSQILRRKGYSPQNMGYESFKEWMQDLHIHIENNLIVFP